MHDRTLGTQPAAPLRAAAARRRGPLRTTLRRLKLLLLVPLCAVLAMQMYGAVAHRWQVVPMLSDSMRPGIGRGSAAVAVRAPIVALQPGDVIVYRDPEQGAILAHRVVKLTGTKERPKIQTRGDTTQVLDPWVAQLEGGSIWRVQFAVPFVGHALIAARHPQARPIGLLVLGLLVLVRGLLAIWRRPEARVEDAAPVVELPLTLAPAPATPDATHDSPATAADDVQAAERPLQDEPAPALPPGVPHDRRSPDSPGARFRRAPVQQPAAAGTDVDAGPTEVRPVPATAPPKTPPAATRAGQTVRAAAGFRLAELEQVVDRLHDPVRAHELRYYVILFRSEALPDGSLPASFDSLVREVFGPFLAQERLAA